MILWSAILEVWGRDDFLEIYTDAFQKTCLSMFIEDDSMNITDLLEQHHFHDSIVALGLASTPVMVRVAAGFISNNEVKAGRKRELYNKVFRGKQGKESVILSLMSQSLLLRLGERLRQESLISYSYLEQIQYLVCSSQKPYKKRRSQAAFRNCAQMHHWLCYLSDLAVNHGIEDFWHPHYDGGETATDPRLAAESLALEIGCICDSEGKGQCHPRTFVLVPGAQLIASDTGISSAERVELLKSANLEHNQQYPMLETWRKDRSMEDLTQSRYGSTLIPWTEVRRRNSEGEDVLKKKCDCAFCQQVIYDQTEKLLRLQERKNVRTAFSK